MRFFATILLLSLSVVLTGCHKPEVKFTDMRPAPTATVSGDTVTIHLGGDYFNSATYVCPKFRVEGQTIYVFGYRTLREQKREFGVRIAASAGPQSIAVVWIDPDGSRVPVPITK